MQKMKLRSDLFNNISEYELRLETLTIDQIHDETKKLRDSLKNQSYNQADALFLQKFILDSFPDLDDHFRFCAKDLAL